MKNTLFVAGDSYSALSSTQSLGVSWSEILATKLNLNLYNVGRPHSSNLGIVTQIDFILNLITESDFVVVLLTDRNRALLPCTVSQIERKNFMLHQGLHRLQVNQTGLDYELDRLLVPTRFRELAYKDFYMNYFNADLAQFKDEYMLTGAFAKILNKTQKLLVCSGGFNNELEEKVVYNFDSSIFNLANKNFIDFSSARMQKIGEDQNSINHISEIGHAKIASLFYSKIQKEFLD